MSSEAATLASLRQVHVCRGRVRWHYRRSSGQPLDCQGLSYAITDLAGVQALRFNPKASSLVISFDWRVT
ncbi:MAG: hypothetical protein RR836_10890, partial [Aeromonas sp.]